MMGNYIKNISSKTSLTVKSLLITLIVGIAIWTILDYFQTAKLREIFHQELVRELGVEAADRDVEIERYIAVHFQSAEIISSNVGMRNYVETVSWSEGEDITYKEYLEKPEWLAGASVVKDFLNIRSALLLDRHYRVREIFHEDTAVLPPEILSPMAALVEASQLKSHIVEAGGIPYIIASRKVPGLLNAPEAILMIVAPLDNDFLLDALRGYRSDVIVALINSEKIISSSNARVLPMNTDIGRIEEKYLVFKDEVLSQRVARFDMFFVNIVSKAKYELMIGSVLNVERLNRAITAAALLLVFSGIIFFITRKVRKVSTMMGAFVSETLNTNQSALDSGDELYIMERQFDFLKRQILSYNKAMFKTAATLSYERDRTQNYFDVAGVMIIAVNTDYEVTRINRMGCEIMGCDKSMIIGKNWLDEYVTASDRRRVREIFTGLISGSYDGIQTGEFLVNRCDGQERVMLWNMSVLREGKNVTGVLSSCEDITDRKAVEHKLHKSNIELAVKNDELKTLFKELDATNKERQKIMDCVGDLIILADNAGKIQRVNEPVCSFAGKLNEDILGMDWEILLSELGLIAQTFYAGSIELYHQGSGRWFSMTSYVIEDTELALAGNVITLHETTEIKAITEELEHTSAEIEASREAIKTALEQISNLIQNVTMNTDYEIVIHNDYMAKCYEMKNCGKINCPCYGIEPERCWQVAGTYCGGPVQGEFAQQYGNCPECIFYKKTTSNPIPENGEKFNNMMHMLKTKNKIFKDSYENI
ncbi:PAS domain S-box protein, partial [bacterium]|nr:PAS domain S-box protein [bacterium]